MMSNKQEKRDRLRQERAAQEAALEKKAKRKRLLLQLGGVTGVAAIVVAILIVISLSGGEKKEVDKTLLGGIPQKGIVLGNPDAPITVVEFADLQCPHCKDFDVEIFPGIVKKYVRTGKVKFELRFLNILGDDSVTAAQFAYATAEQNKLWQFTDTFYHNQEAEGSGYITDDFLREMAGKVPGLKIEQVFSSQNSSAVKKLQEEGDSLASESGIESTPTFLITKDGETVKADSNSLEDELELLVEG